MSNAYGLYLLTKPPEDNQTIRPDVSDGKITITGSQSAMLFDELGWRHSKTMP
ncbi:hypothetical protein NZS14_001600 [Salmonella enterica]|nr:hypothetical protein [Salmonella enterica]EJQ2221452.1 hypothetical protein [Salmonella enterica]